MKIRKLQLKNIGVFDDETIEFQECPEDKAEIHIFTGQNGSGKTTILQALANTFNYWFGEIYNEENKGRIGKLIENPNSDIKNIFTKKFSSGSELIVKFDNDKEIEFSLDEFWGDIEYRTTYESLKRYRLLSARVNNFHRINSGVFAYSGNRYIEAERIDAIKEPDDFNPLHQSLEFKKDYSQPNQLTINQLIANNISKSAIESRRNVEKATKFALVVSSIENFIFEITNWKIKIDMETEPINLILKIEGKELDFDVLPDGLRSLISWIADLLSRVDLLKWEDDLPIFEKNLILLLDEIEVHLHPAWQRKVLPVVQKLFKNAQIFVSTHSPFVVNSVDDAWVYKLELKDGKAKVADVVKSEDGISYQTVLSEIFGIDEEFGGKTQEDLDKFYKIVRNGKKINEKELLTLAKSLAVQSEELNSIVQIELRQLSRRKGKEFSL